MNSTEFQDLADITDCTKAFYAARWGYESQFRVDDQLAGPRGSWRRVELWLSYLRMEAWNWMFFTGTDAAIINHEKSIEKLFELSRTPYDLFISADGNGINSDSWIMRNCQNTRKLLYDMLRWEGLANNEQDALNLCLSKCSSYHAFTQRVGNLRQGGEPPSIELLQKLERELNKSDVYVNIVPQVILNAYANELYSPYPQATKSPNQWSRERSLVLHLPGVDQKRRIEYFNKIL